MSTLDTNDPQDLLFGPSWYIAQLLGCDIRTARRYKSGSSKLPPLATKLLQLHYGDLAGVLGPDWQGFRIGRDGLLYTPLHHRGMSALQISAMFFEHQEVIQLRVEVKKLRAELDHERARIFADAVVSALVRDALRKTGAGR